MYVHVYALLQGSSARLLNELCASHPPSARLVLLAQGLRALLYALSTQEDVGLRKQCLAALKTLARHAPCVSSIMASSIGDSFLRAFKVLTKYYLRILWPNE